MKKKTLTCKDCKFLVAVPDGLSGKKKASCCFYHEKHNLETDKLQKDCALYGERVKGDIFSLDEENEDTVKTD